MSSRRALLAQSRNLEINTIIGGMGAVLPTREDLASRLQVSQRQIRNFEIVGNDIHCTMMQLYGIPESCFQNDTNITDYIDLDNKIRSVGLQAFMSSTLINFYAPNAIIKNGGLYCNFTNADFGYEYLNLRENPLGEINGLRNSRIKKLNAPNAIVLGGSTLHGNTELLEVYAPNLTSISTTTFQGCSALTTINTVNVTRIGQRAFISCSSIPSFNLPALTEIFGAGVFYNASGATELLMPLLESVISGNRAELFRGMSSCNLISMRKLKVLGDATVASTNTFQALKTSCTIEVHEDMATSNAGNADATLQWAKDNRSAIVEFYDDNGNYVSTL